jgi:hypothetical protein
MAPSRLAPRQASRATKKPGAGLVKLAFRFEDNGTDHDDMVLYLGGQTWRCDSYYFKLDARPEYPTVRSVLTRLLEQWRLAVQSLGDGESCFVPYELWDECTSWLSCQRCGEDVLVSRVTSWVAGYAVSPSNIGAYAKDLPGYRPDGPAVRMSVKELLEAIEESLIEARK